jgi:hypothetical protein
MRRTEVTVSMVLEALIREPESAVPNLLRMPDFLPSREKTCPLMLAQSSGADNL